jgi:acyl carrier protein
MTEENIKDIVITSLADFLGVTKEDITIEDSLSDDLHISPADLSDYLESLSSKGLNTNDLKMENIDTVGELIDELILETDL